MSLDVVAITFGPLFTQAEAKTHLRVDGAGDDDIIDLYSDAAVAYALQYCNIDVVPNNILAVAAFKAAALICLADLYENRSSALLANTIQTRTFETLINPYRWLRV